MKIFLLLIFICRVALSLPSTGPFPPQHVLGNFLGTKQAGSLVDQETAYYSEPTASTAENASHRSLMASNFWYENIEHNGISPFIPNGQGAKWKVFRNVVQDYGADNTGVRDASVAIQNAINGESIVLELICLPAFSHICSLSAFEQLVDSDKWIMIPDVLPA